MNQPNKPVEELSAEEKVKLLAQVQQESSNPHSQEFPLSYGQRALWLLHRLAPESAAFNVLFAARIRSKLEVSALHSAFQLLLDRHNALRTTFLSRQGEPVQRIHSSMAVDFEEIDATAWSEPTLHARLTTEAHQPFDLERGPMVRVRLFNRSAEERYLLFSAHHIVIDGWSLWICLDELRALYSAARTGTSPTLQAVPQYTDYLRWQTEMLEGPEGSWLWQYWRQQLAGNLSVLRLPTDHPRPSTQTYRGLSHFFRVDGELTRRLKLLSKSVGATLYMTLVAAFQVLLYRYSQQEDILIGSPLPCRNLSEFERVVGYCANPVVLRSNLGGNPTFRSLLRQVRDTVLNALEHQAFPFPLLVDRLQPNRDASRSPIFQVMFVLQRPHHLVKEGLAPFILGEAGARMEFGELTLEALPFPIQQEGQFDLMLNFVEVGESLSASFDYNADLFDAGTVARMEAHLRTLMEGIVSDADERVAQLALLSSQERHHLKASSSRVKSFPQAQRLHEIFEKQVERAPEAIAVSCGPEELSYEQLNCRANQLAHYLMELGVGPEITAAICVERSLDMVIGILAILKAGGAYLPLDPAYPKERLAFMLQDAQARVILTQTDLLRKLPAQGINVIRVDSDRQAIAQRSKDNPASRATPANLAYVIYTSGSTGIPKGVLITHENVGRLFEATKPLFQFNEHDVWTLFHSYAFDFSVWEFWGAFLYGGRLVVVPFETSRSPAELYALLCREKVTVLNQTPSAFRQLMWAQEDLERSGWNLSLRFIIFGGEALDVQRLRPWFERYGHERPRLVNMYGITETTVHVTHRSLETSDARIARPTPIGVPIEDLQVYLLDAYLNPVPIGVPGELFVGGDGLARGYLNRPELTAERFVPDPFGHKPGSRLYRTGDQGRYRPDGTIEFLGRTDHQVKLRGFRVEPGEIEAQLASHPSIREAAVVAREDSPGDVRLVAYVVADEGTASIPGELRVFLKEKLPDFMVPASFVFMNALPLTPNGKLDRRGLPHPDRLTAESEVAGSAPQTELERAIAAIWQEMLHLERVSVHDNFFDLGGNSLLMTRVHGKLKELGLKELSMVALFQFPTISALAGFLAQERSDTPPKPQSNARVEQMREGRERLHNLQRRRSGGKAEKQDP